MKKKAIKAMKKYLQWVEDDFIHTEWEHEDYENVMVYEDVNGDIICIERDENNNIIDAWEE